MIKRMVRWHILPRNCVPDSCIVNIYDGGDCIPPHIDHHDFARPFCTVSFLSECNILFGSNLKIVSPGEFAGPVSIPLPVGYASRIFSLVSYCFYFHCKWDVYSLQHKTGLTFLRRMWKANLFDIFVLVLPISSFTTVHSNF